MREEGEKGEIKGEREMDEVNILEEKKKIWGNTLFFFYQF